VEWRLGPLEWVHVHALRTGGGGDCMREEWTKEEMGEWMGDVWARAQNTHTHTHTHIWSKRTDLNCRGCSAYWDALECPRRRKQSA
jgi:hypothetical protein